jgi:hypothetical protein
VCGWLVAEFLVAGFYLDGLIAGFYLVDKGAETPAARILEFRPPGCPPVGSPQVSAPMGTLR